MAEKNQNKRPLQIDWTQILEQNDVEPAPLLIVKEEQPKPSPMSITEQSAREECKKMTDRDIDEAIKRHKSIRKLSLNLKDGGHKLREWLSILEDEQRRRLKLRDSQTDVDVCETPSQMMTSDCIKQENAPFAHQSQSDFASCFSRKLEDTHCSTKAFDKELSILAPCSHRKKRSNGVFSQKGSEKGQSSSRQWPFRSARQISHNRGDDASDDDLKGRASSTNTSHQNGKNALCNYYSRSSDDCQVQPSNGSRRKKGQTLVLLDEDEIQLVEVMEQEKELAECMKDAKIYYPSSDDRECVEICYTDIKSLAPESFLTSPIMNFYIRYLRLQTSPSNKAISDCHFFNTFFYKKLKQATAYKGSDKESYFIKFRRWWKGINIFQKSYVLIPIHEDLHWSLVIICIPDKEDESGPIILHLDSLGFHFSKTVFEDIRSFLKQEWNYMKQEVAPSDIPIAERIWNRLPRRIEEKKIEVPQQKNDYDCGLFVLFFMERFIEEAPERLKKKDLAMFGKRWFKPEEASSLRVKIKKLLLDEFKKAKDSCSPSPTS